MGFYIWANKSPHYFNRTMLIFVDLIIHHQAVGHRHTLPTLIKKKKKSRLQSCVSFTEMDTTTSDPNFLH
ncbi:hypothetical protein NC653_014830 [Populus alba x Populus x berolinensis]|uniref:Uncharacterized protein n=1 Tax=Populus alba x Populus x berolinensis TaxID=444605 RepID=A0AAD6QYA0_9ROSI|nr:hypothetical protein NC653_014830 [Populus alba x Populus x berolinensis]